MKKLLSFYFTVLSAAAMAGCSGSVPDAVSRSVNVDSRYCQLTKDHTLLTVGPYTIKIFEPDSLKNPEVWQGPLCVTSELSNVNCGFDLSLIKSVTPVADMTEIEVVTFSGSNRGTASISLANCQVTYRK